MFHAERQTDGQDKVAFWNFAKAANKQKTIKDDTKITGGCVLLESHHQRADMMKDGGEK